MGASGAGKSSLALKLMSLGATLVSDDQTWLNLRNGSLIASAPETIKGLIEARGVGLLRADTVESAAVALAIDMDQPETERLPIRREIALLGLSVNLLHKVEHDHFPAAILQYLRAGRDA